ncbi:Zinc finger CCCH domain-containing protein 10 [Sarcoptes scabiei]|nr:Alpha-N-acetylgalactosaminidase-like protein [Sarcoptes scabiei]UXI23193.1 Zinc finger CCCH domain-containing protein 10 [Sarcoptes scabiei]
MLSIRLSIFLVPHCLLLFLKVLILLNLFNNKFIVVEALNNGLARTPPMGWLSWERFKCQIDCHQGDNESGDGFAECISENLFKQIADVIVHDGYRDAGYNHINIDDCWSKKARELESGDLLPDPERFPSGMKQLADYMHQRGLKLGIYQNLGHRTCMNYPGIIDHMEQDLKSFLEWDIDWIKLDACFTSPSKLNDGYLKFRKLIDQIKRPIIFSCSWPYYQIFSRKEHIVPAWSLISMNCNLFRVYHDTTTNWLMLQKIIDFMGDHQNIFRKIIKPGSWPDPDMLMIGNPGLTVDQAQSHMAFWCMLPAPLLMSNDPRKIDYRFKNILLNKNAIAINQDEQGHPAERFLHNKAMDLWIRKLTNDCLAVLILNRRTKKKLRINISLGNILPNEMAQKDAIEIQNVFTNETINFEREKFGQKKFKIQIRKILPPCGCLFLRLKPSSKKS